MRATTWDQIQELIAMGARAPRVDTIERQHRLVLQANSPGFGEDDLDVPAGGCAFNLQGECDENTDHDGILEMSVPKSAIAKPASTEGRSR